MGVEEEPPHVRALATRFPRLFAGGARRHLIWCPPGWEQIVVRLLTHIDLLLTDAQADRFRIDQIKEKFGTLRLYYTVGKQKNINIDVLGTGGHLRFVNQLAIKGFPARAVDDFIADAERESAVTCCRCGEPGALRQGAWIHVYCDRCEELREKELRERTRRAQ